MGTIVYRGQSYGDKELEVEGVLVDPTEMELTDEQINRTESIPLELEKTKDGVTTKVKMKLPTSLVISNGVVIDENQKKQIFTKSEEVNEVVTDQGYKLVYGQMGNRFIWQGLNVLFGKINTPFFDIGYGRLEDNPYANGNTNGRTLNDVYVQNSYTSKNMSFLWTEELPRYYVKNDIAYSSSDFSPESEIGSTSSLTYYIRADTGDVYYNGTRWGYYYNLVKEEDKDKVDLNKKRITPEDRQRIAESNNTVAKQYIANFITKEDLYDFIPLYKIRTEVYHGSETTSNTHIKITLKTDSSTTIILVADQYATSGASFLLPSNVDTFGFFLYSQKWSSSGAGVGIGVAGFEGDDLVYFVPLGFLYSSGSAAFWNKELITPWRNYYKVLKSNIVYGYLIEGTMYGDENKTNTITSNVNRLYFDNITQKYYTTNQTSYYQTSVVDYGEYIVFTGGTGYNTNSSFHTVLSNDNSPEYKYAVGITSKYEHVSKTQFEQISGIDLDE